MNIDNTMTVLIPSSAAVAQSNTFEELLVLNV